MTIRTLIPSYSENNHRNSLRHDLCDIIYSDYKGVTFFLDQQLKEKQTTLNKIYDFLKVHPEIIEYKNDTNYWYPYKNVDGTRELSLHNSYYPNTDDEITYFCKKGENDLDNYDYLFDPVKLHFFLMCTDIRKMDGHSDTAKEIIKINNELFEVLFNTVGDTISYNGLTTIEHINKYIQEGIKDELEVKNNPEHSQDFKDHLLRHHQQFNNFSYLINEAIIVCNQQKLDNELSQKEELKKPKKKI